MPYWTNYFMEINSCIPGKGKQQLEIQIYPRYTDLTTQKTSLEDGIDFELVIGEKGGRSMSEIPPF